MAEQQQNKTKQEPVEVVSTLVLNPTEQELEEWREAAEERHREWLFGLRDHGSN